MDASGDDLNYDSELYALEAFERGDGEGVRIYRIDDALYEAVHEDDTEIRLYREDESWNVDVRFMVQDDEEAYDEIRDVLASLDAEDDLPPGEYHDSLKRRSHVTVDTGGTTVRYNQENEIDLPTEVQRELLGACIGSSKNVALGSFIGGLIGSAVGGIAGGSVGGPFGAVPAWVAGGAAGSTLGGSILGGSMSLHEYREYKDGNVTEQNWVAPSIEAWKREVDHDGPLFDMIDEERDLFEDINTIERVALLRQEAGHYDKELFERKDELEEVYSGSPKHDFFQMQFTDFDRTAGVHVRDSFPTYGDATDFIETAADTDIRAETPPSRFDDVTVFKKFFDELTYTEDGETEVLSDGATLIREATATDDRDPAIDTYLQDQVPDTVDEIGVQELLAIED